MTVQPVRGVDRENPNLPGLLVDWIGQLTISQGRRAGERFEVLDWEREFLRGAFRPGIAEAGLTMGRGGGKSCFVGAVAAAALAGPLARPRAEVLIVASSFAQAHSSSWEDARRFLDPWIQAEGWRVRDSGSTAEVERPDGARVVALGSDPRRLHGRRPSLVLADEPAQWPPGQSDRMIAALRTALGKQPGARLVALGTRSGDPLHWFEALLGGGPGVFSLRHQAPPDADPMDPAAWLAANPSLPMMPDLERAIAREAEAAASDPAQLAAFRSLRLNAGTLDTTEDVLISRESWARCEVENLPERSGPLFVGFDLGSGAAMSAAAGFWPETGRVEALASFSTVPSLEERGLQDGVGSLYRDMHREGDLLTLPGRVVDPADLVLEIMSRWGSPDLVVADDWHFRELLGALEKAGVRPADVISRRMGMKTGSEDVRAFRRAVLSGKVRARRSLLISAALRDARVVGDSAGNSKLAKSTQGGRRATARDDVAAALLLAISAGTRDRGRQRARYLGVV